MITESQEELVKLRTERFLKFTGVKNIIELGKGFGRLYLYGSLALKEAYEKAQTNKRAIPIFDIEFEPNPWTYQYDLEIYIFLYYDVLKARELELRKDSDRVSKYIIEYGPTLLKREEHLANAMCIRWPERKLPNGEIIGTVVKTPWLMDYFYSISNYKNSVVFGGAGQGKTYGNLAFMCMIFDNFIHTKGGAQCSYSSVSEAKLKASTWAYVNKLYNAKLPYQFSLYAGLAKRSVDFTFIRIDPETNRKREEGGVFCGVLLPRGMKDARVIDKLTGCHDPIARIYLLDEAQSTDSAPMQAYNNMFLHPKWGWFTMSGNYEEPRDLLGVNVEPNTGWDSVNEATHIWEGTLKTKEESMHQPSLVIHYNNELSPGVTDPEFGKKYGRFVPTLAKRDQQYPTPESKKSYGYKRFWIGFRYVKEDKIKRELILTRDLLEGTNASDNIDPKYKSMVNIGSLDTAPASIDRSPYTVFSLCLDDNGYPLVWPNKIYLLPKPTHELKYLEEMSEGIIKINNFNNIKSRHFIMDWTQRDRLIEKLNDKGIICHHIIYQEKVPDGTMKNKITQDVEPVVYLPSVKLMAGRFEKNALQYAHDKIKNKITLGAYIFRMFVEQGRVRGLNASLLNNLTSNGFEKEFLSRNFTEWEKGASKFINLDSKEQFHNEFGFSPDILDTFFQAFYLLYVIFKVEPTKKGLGLLQLNKGKKVVDKSRSIWDVKLTSS